MMLFGPTRACWPRQSKTTVCDGDTAERADAACADPPRMNPVTASAATTGTRTAITKTRFTMPPKQEQAVQSLRRRKAAPGCESKPRLIIEAGDQARSV